MRLDASARPRLLAAAGVATAVAARFNPEPIGLPAALQARPNFPMAQRLRTERADGRVTMSCLVSVLSSVGGCARRARAPRCAYCRTEKRTGCEPSERSSPSRLTGWPHGRRRAGGRQILWPGPPGVIEVPRGERLRLQPQAKLLPRRLGGQRGQWGGDERSAGPTSEDGASVNAYVRDVLDTTQTTPPRA